MTCPIRTSDPRDVLDVLCRPDVLPGIQVRGSFYQPKEDDVRPLVENDDNWHFVSDTKDALVSFFRDGANLYDTHIGFGESCRGSKATWFFRESVRRIFGENPKSGVLIGRPAKGRKDVGVFLVACGFANTHAGYILVRKD
jgi:hypothetical protein